MNADRSIDVPVPAALTLGNKHTTPGGRKNLHLGREFSEGLTPRAEVLWAEWMSAGLPLNQAFDRLRHWIHEECMKGDAETEANLSPEAAAETWDFDPKAFENWVQNDRWSDETLELMKNGVWIF